MTAGYFGTSQPTGLSHQPPKKAKTRHTSDQLTQQPLPSTTKGGQHALYLGPPPYLKHGLGDAVIETSLDYKNNRNIGIFHKLYAKPYGIFEFSLQSLQNVYRGKLWAPECSKKLAVVSYGSQIDAKAH